MKLGQLSFCRPLVALLMSVCLGWTLVSCGGDRAAEPPIASVGVGEAAPLSETAPPQPIRTLSRQLAAAEPQVQIVSPRQHEIMRDRAVTVQVQVQDLPIFKDAALQLGPHLQVILDDEDAIALYNLNEPLVFENLAAGNHLLRVFAVTPWGESFKNEGAYAQTEFAILTTNRAHQPDPTLPLLTYNSPQGDYGAEPILLDFFLSNAPVRLGGSETATGDRQRNLTDWRIRVTVNDQSFLLDHWQSFYLKGFQPGLNWVKLAFLDANGQLVEPSFNNPVGIVNYQPGLATPLAALMTDAIAPAELAALTDPTYRETQAQETTAPTPAPSAEQATAATSTTPEPAEPEVMPAAAPPTADDQGTGPAEALPERQPPAATPDAGSDESLGATTVPEETAAPETEPRDRETDISSEDVVDTAATATVPDQTSAEANSATEAETLPPLLDANGSAIAPPVAEDVNEAKPETVAAPGASDDETTNPAP